MKNIKLIVLIVVISFSSCTVINCPTNDRNYFYKAQNIKPIKSKNQLNCYHF